MLQMLGSHAPTHTYPVAALQIEAFVPEYWGGEIYHDVDKAFYKVRDTLTKTPAQYGVLGGSLYLVGCDVHGAHSWLAPRNVMLAKGDLLWLAGSPLCYMHDW